MVLDLPRLVEGDFYFFSDSLDFTSSPGAPGQIDFLTLIVHELGHVLGFDTIAFENFEVAAEFTGANAVAANGGNNIQLAGEGAEANHIAGSDLLGVSTTNNLREAITDVHIGIFQDLGLPITAASESSDTLYGFNLADDTVSGLGGSDALFGLTGNDTLLGMRRRL